MDKKKYTVHFSNEYGKLKQMNIRQKIGYIWDYHKVYFFLLMLAALVVFYIADALHQRSREIVLQGFFSNDDYNLFDAGAIAEDFGKYLNLNSKQRVVFDDSLYIELDSASEYVVASQGKISGYIAAKELDFIVTTPELVQHYSTHIPLMDLEDFLPNNLLSNLNEYLYYVEGMDSVKKAYALDLSQSRFMKNTDYKGDTSYFLIIPSNVPASEALFSFVRYAFDD
ncbi:MAG: hypothetical protein E6600_10160 [Anaerocolumna aminovalerica]|uniref:hypothetical protein n=1 Tax=Anaerocolumna aminovalerica TaxID=1527 RepID=UPI002905FF35|nr:hypothetical protein [Anaerocolumna aminovalerica]MDU6264853.1 hypothetical protein [Anaerocolumna aminovalerica]